MTTPTAGDLAFLGPAHISQLSDFQYVDLVELDDTTATVKLIGPMSEEEDEGKVFSLSLEVFGCRAVPAHERGLWPGSFVAHRVAFARTSPYGIDEWSYGVESGYRATEQVTTLHVICTDSSVRLPLTTTTMVIKADVLNYALQTGAGVNTAAVTIVELLDHQNKVIAACQRRRSGLPKQVTTSMSVSYSGDDIVPLIRPSTLQLVRVRRQHIVDYTRQLRELSDLQNCIRILC
ncbi:hypothetical protein JG688_00012469 [Phytophthora aleatoria]|uniref:Uncharacterized protein n=1 Tax=Phytophthora aleatoria TaxID=2496075 RepID=A0A8J5IPZ1_9STRA|nr:hypothetical protein JG688_00012469 [Phytophthora aleatoria]